jgi:hypothetical protein
MAKDVETPEEEWEEISTGIGEQWDFDKNGDLIGTFLGAENIELKEPRADGKTTALAWRFATDSDELVFIWDSYQLGLAMTEAGSGDRVKIHFDGYREFDNGSRRIKQYKVFMKKQS